MKLFSLLPVLTLVTGRSLNTADEEFNNYEIFEYERKHECILPDYEEYKRLNPDIEPVYRPFDEKRDNPFYWVNTMDNGFYYSLDGITSDLAKRQVEEALRLIKIVLGDCIKIEPRTTQRHYVIFRDNQPASRSFVGRMGGAQYIDLRETGPGVITTVHETFHALGLHHLHQRQDALDYIDIDLNNVGQKNAKHNFESLEFDVYDTKFDFDSVMLYGSFAFSKDAKSPTMTKKNGSLFKQNRKYLNQGDIDFFRRAYKCPTTLPYSSLPIPRLITAQAQGTVNKGRFAVKPPVEEKRGRFTLSDADNYLNFFKPPQNWKKLAGFNIYHIKNENFPQIQNIDDCAQMTLQLNGKSFDYSAFGCYINAGDTSTYGSLLESSDRYSYYELLKPFN